MMRNSRRASFDVLSEEQLLGCESESRSTSSSSYANSNSSEESIEDLLLQISGGSGTYNRWVLLKCALANAADAVEIVAVSFILPHAGDELNLDGWAKGLLTACIFLGMMFGGWLWGALSDSLGRTSVLRSALLLNAVFGLLSAAAPDFYTLVFCRFMSGLGVGGSIPVIFSYCSEFLHSSVRGRDIALMAISWPMGTLFASTMAWAIIPTGGWPLSSWRIFLIPCSLPALIGSVVFWKFADESFKWQMYSQRNFKAAASTMRKIAMANQCEMAEDSLDAALLKAIVDKESRKEQMAVDNSANAPSPKSLSRIAESSNAMSAVWFKTQLMFEPCYRRAFIAQLIIYFGLSFAFYGCYEFLPSYFDSLSNANPYVSSLVSSGAQVPGVLLTSWLLENDYLSRGSILAISMLLSCVCLLFGGVFVNGGSTQVVALMAAFSGLSVFGWTVLDVITPELWPTVVRSTAFGFLTAVGRIGAICGDLIFGFFSHDSFVLPMLFSAVSLFVAALAGMTLPSMKGKAIH